MNKVFLCAISMLLLTSCGLDDARIKAEQERDALAKELEEIKFGAPNLLADARRLMQAGDFATAKSKLEELRYRHGDRPEAAEGKLLLREIKEEETWIAALSTQESYATEKYISNYPIGKYASAAKKRLRELTVANEGKAYENARQANTSKAWKQFLDTYPNHPQAESIRTKIIDLEVNEIFGDRATGRLPSFDRIGGGGYSTSSSISITNDTGCPLTVRYSGPQTMMIEIPEGRSKNVNLISGSYRIAASACGANYAGSEALFGDYSSKYYITRTRY